VIEVEGCGHRRIVVAMAISIIESIRAAKGSQERRR
jgi:hypothetical protein